MKKIKHLLIITGSLLGQFVSQLGDAAYMVGLPWAVYAVTGDFLKVAGYYLAVAAGGIVFGLVGLAWSLPAMLILGFMIGCTVAVTRIVSATAMQAKVDSPAIPGKTRIAIAHLFI
ncbi:MAG: hypothetical protein GX493_03685 [Firmicutes bacterium]|nr:hypothetical protein [Bacillota bacterium]